MHNCLCYSKIIEMHVREIVKTLSKYHMTFMHWFRPIIPFQSFVIVLAIKISYNSQS